VVIFYFEHCFSNFHITVSCFKFLKSRIIETKKPACESCAQSIKSTTNSIFNHLLVNLPGAVQITDIYI
jgi:hypothetical protein